MEKMGEVRGRRNECVSGGRWCGNWEGDWDMEEVCYLFFF